MSASVLTVMTSAGAPEVSVPDVDLGVEGLDAALSATSCGTDAGPDVVAGPGALTLAAAAVVAAVTKLLAGAEAAPAGEEAGDTAIVGGVAGAATSVGAADREVTVAGAEELGDNELAWLGVTCPAVR